MAEQVEHRTINGKYRVVIERSAVKGIDGFKVEVNSDDIECVKMEADLLYKWACLETLSKES